jgi:ribosomal protein S20
VRTLCKTNITKAERFIFLGDLAAAQEAVMVAVTSLDKAAEKGIIHPNNAARRKSRLMKKFNQLQEQAPAEAKPAKAAPKPKAAAKAKATKAKAAKAKTAKPKATKAKATKTTKAKAAPKKAKKAAAPKKLDAEG